VDTMRRIRIIPRLAEVDRLAGYDVSMMMPDAVCLMTQLATTITENHGYIETPDMVAMETHVFEDRWLSQNTQADVDVVGQLMQLDILRPVVEGEKPLSRKSTHDVLSMCRDSNPAHHLQQHGFRFRIGGPSTRTEAGSTERLSARAYTLNGQYFTVDQGGAANFLAQLQQQQSEHGEA